MRMRVDSILSASDAAVKSVAGDRWRVSRNALETVHRDRLQQLQTPAHQRAGLGRQGPDRRIVRAASTRRVMCCGNQQARGNKWTTAASNSAKLTLHRDHLRRIWTRRCFIPATAFAVRKDGLLVTNRHVGRRRRTETRRATRVAVKFCRFISGLQSQRGKDFPRRRSRTGESGKSARQRAGGPGHQRALRGTVPTRRPGGPDRISARLSSCLWACRRAREVAQDGHLVRATVRQGSSRPVANRRL